MVKKDQNRSGIGNGALGMSLDGPCRSAFMGMTNGKGVGIMPIGQKGWGEPGEKGEENSCKSIEGNSLSTKKT